MSVLYSAAVMQKRLPLDQGVLAPAVTKQLIRMGYRWFLRGNRRISAFWGPYQQILFSYLGGFLGIAALAYLTSYLGHPLIAAPLGATAVLVFGVPDSPLAQPRNVIGGNTLAALVSVTLVHLFGADPWVMALAVATAIKLMQLTKTVHPPGGAVALLGVMTHVAWDYIFTPILLGSVLIVLCTVIFNNMVPGRPYPKQWF